MQFKLKILTPNGIYFDNNVDSLSLETATGRITILFQHVNFISNVEICAMSIRFKGATKLYAIGGGVLLIEDNAATLIVNSITSHDEIDIKRAIEEKEEAEKMLMSNSSIKQYKKAEVKLKTALAKINTIKYNGELHD